jgi:RepB DNA-primase from phage plasmid
MLDDGPADKVKDIEKFWRHIFGGQRGRLAIFTAKRDADSKIDRETIVSNNFNYPGAAESAAGWALEKSEEGRDVYSCAHLLSAPRRVKENAAPIRTLWGEFDGAPVPNGELKPTAVVESSPGNYHCYWRLDAEIPPETAECINRRIAERTGADPSGADLTQLLRVPGTVNHKYPGEPVVSIVDLDGGRSYDAAALDKLLPASAGPQAEQRPDEDHGEEPPVVLPPEALKVYRGEAPRLKENGEVDRSVTLLHIGRVLYEAGANRRVVVEGVRERDKTLGFDKYTGNRDGGQREYERIFEKLEESGRSNKVRVIFGGGEPSPAKPEWPTMDEAAYRGLFGDIVETVEPHTEGDPVAVLTGAIVAVGNAMGRGPYVQIGATKHRTNLFIGHVGETAKGRKGSAWKPVQDIMHASDAHWTENRIASGLSSGEGLISEVRDPIQVSDGDGGTKTVDEGVADKRLLVMESELSQALKMMKREGNTLSPVMRNAWDGETLRTMVKHSPHRATDPHISVAGHITLAELTRYLTETEMANGLANRFQWFLVRRSKSLPFGGDWYTVNLAPVTSKLAGILEYANQNVRMSWGEDARSLWCEAYDVLTEDRPGMFGAITARAEAQALRLAMIYALVDYSHEIRRSHVESALAVWEYAEASALYCFGDATGDPDADKVLGTLRRTEGGLTRTEISEMFGRNKSRQELDRIREALIKAGKLRVSLKPEDGSKKPVERWEVA